MQREEAVQILWDFLTLGREPQPADCIVAFGSYDLTVAERAAQLFLDGYAPLLVMSGGLGRVTKDIWGEAEAVKYARIAREMGVPADKIVMEDRSTNTGENIRYTREALAGRGIRPASVLAVQKPYMERRLFASLKKQWPEVECFVTSPQISMAEYFRLAGGGAVTAEELIHIMVGDLSRMEAYARQGFQIPQEIPPEVRAACGYLVDMGYTRDIVR